MADAVVNINVSAAGDAAAKFAGLGKSADAAGDAVKKLVGQLDHFESVKAKIAQKDAAPAMAAQAAKVAKAKNDSAAADKAAALEATEHRRAGEQRIAGATRLTGAVGRGGAAGGLSAMGGKAGLVGAGIEAFGQAMERTTKAVEISGNTYTTSAQKTRELVAEFVPLGGTIIKLGDAIDGTTNKLRQNAERFEVAKAQDAVAYDYRAKIASAGMEQKGYAANLNAVRGNPMAAYQTYDRGTLAGERATGEQEHRLGAANATTVATREADAAQEMKRNAAAAVKAADARFYAQQGRVADAASKYRGIVNSENSGGGRNKAGRDAAAQSELLERSRLTKEIAVREEAIAKAKDAGVKSAQAEHGLRQTVIGQQKAELAILREKEGRMRGMAQGAGAMGRGEFMANANALKMYQQADGQDIPPEIEAMAAKLAPDLVRKNQEKRGEGRYDELKGVLGDEGFKDAFRGDFSKGGGLGDTRAAGDKLAANIQVNIDLDAAKMAAELATQLGPVLANLIKFMAVSLEGEAGKVKSGMAVRNNAPG